MTPIRPRTDERRWDAALALISAAEALRTAVRDYGAFSPEARAAQEAADRALRDFRRMNPARGRKDMK